MPSYQLACGDCGTGITTHTKNTKYCPTCRLARSLEYVESTGQTSAKCWVCEERFRPIKRGEKFCGSCMTFKYERGSCGICGAEDAPRLVGHLAICTSCAHSPDVKTRGRLMRALAAKQAEQAANPEPIPAAPEPKPIETQEPVPCI